ncbi:MAG: hypothetical protein JWP46_3141 [Modestobacter sp.]|nr:hypothetical protein [Modestobacter sp.]
MTGAPPLPGVARGGERPVIDLDSDVGEGFGSWGTGPGEELLQHLEMSVPELTDAVLHQLGALDVFARSGGDWVRHLKPHGALYHAAAQREDQAAAVVAAAREFDSGPAVAGPPGSRLLAAASAAGLAVAAEEFADRAYGSDGRLVPRSQPGSVLSDLDAVARRTVALATGRADTGEWAAGALPGAVTALCVHSDTPGAERVDRAVRAALEGAGTTVTAFAAAPAGP